MSGAWSSKLRSFFAKIHFIFSVLDNIYFSRFSRPLNLGRQAQDSESLYNIRFQNFRRYLSFTLFPSAYIAVLFFVCISLLFFLHPLSVCAYCEFFLFPKHNYCTFLLLAVNYKKTRHFLQRSKGQSPFSKIVTGNKFQPAFSLCKFFEQHGDHKRHCFPKHSRIIACESFHFRKTVLQGVFMYKQLFRHL